MIYYNHKEKGVLIMTAIIYTNSKQQVITKNYKQDFAKCGTITTLKKMQDKGFHITETITIPEEIINFIKDWKNS